MIGNVTPKIHGTGNGVFGRESFYVNSQGSLTFLGEESRDIDLDQLLSSQFLPGLWDSDLR